jgi:hypothetical protein
MQFLQRIGKILQMNRPYFSAKFFTNLFGKSALVPCNIGPVFQFKKLKRDIHLDRSISQNKFLSYLTPVGFVVLLCAEFFLIKQIFF